MKRPPSTAPPEFPPPLPPSHPNKKTRELPNLSDCNCCNRHINSTNPKNRLGILTSEWRIVLLCRSCYNLVESSQFCSYCLTRVSSEFYDCKKCRRRIHKDCVSKFDCSGNFCGDFSVCFDCWKPNLLVNDFNRSRTVRNGISKKQSGKNGVESTSLSLASSGLCNLQEKGKLVENVRNRSSKKELGKNGVESMTLANVVTEKKISAAIEAGEKVLTKEMEANKGLEVASCALGIVEIDKGGDKGGLVVDKDAQLAIRLHKEMNSSRRISRNVCLLSTHCVDVPKVNGLVSRGANKTSSSGRETNVGFGDNGVKMGSLFGQQRNGSSGERQECGNKFGGALDGKCNGESKSCVITYIRKGQAPKVVKCKEEPSIPVKVYSRKSSHERVEEGKRPFQAVKLEDGENPFQVVKVEAGQCSKTYNRRRLHCKTKLVNSSMNIENGNLTLDTSLTCREESTALTNAL